MEQLTAETQGSSGSETSGYPGAYVPHAREMEALDRGSYECLRAFEIDDARGAFVWEISN